MSRTSMSKTYPRKREWVGDRISPDRELSLGFVPAGLAWVLLGYALGFIRGEQATVEPATPARTTPGPS